MQFGYYSKWFMICKVKPQTPFVRLNSTLSGLTHQSKLHFISLGCLARIISAAGGTEDVSTKNPHSHPSNTAAWINVLD